MLGALGVARPSLASLAARALSPHHRARRVHTPGRVLSMAAPKIGKDGEKVYPEECKVEVGGRQYRRCAAAVCCRSSRSRRTCSLLSARPLALSRR